MTKQTKSQRIIELERKLREAEAQQVHVYHFATNELKKASTSALAGSAVILTLTVLGGKELFKPVAIRGGLSDETISALSKDMVRSYEDVVAFKPKELK